MLERWLHGPVLSFLPRGEGRSWGIPPDCVGLSQGTDYYDMVPCTFLLALMQLVSCSIGVQEPLNWLLNIFQRESILLLLLNLCVHVGKEVLDFLFSLLAGITPNILPM